MKAVLGGIVIALIVTGGNVFVGMLLKWLNGNPIDQFTQLVSIKHLFSFLIILLLSAGYLSIRETDGD
ncbi:hypothetical protein ACFSTH_05455 [Paenibacillus yanchengensis]|uniref:Uncharacterized protein n=1 Tax=Paenibacillus yanchengensis TaxID=2035833 RepID=A0ABW4YHK4_9BACL